MLVRMAIAAVALMLSIVFAGAGRALEPSISEPSPFGMMGTGRVVGKVAVTGGFHRPQSLPVYKNRGICGSTVANETFLVGPHGELRNAVVILRSLDRAAPIRPTPIILDNKRCAFVPHVQVATVGSELLLKNSDPILHTVHARFGNETLFNVGLPRWRRVTKFLDRVGVVTIECDVLHTWMSAAIVITASPYFAVTDENGLFAIEFLPVGVYEMESWHEKLGTRISRVQVFDNTTMTVDVVYAWLNKSG
jgi:hypothetical protein